MYQLLKWIAIFSCLLVTINLDAQGWTQQNSTVNVILRSAHFVSPHTGYVVGDKGTILRTKNGGINWEKLTTPVNASTFNDLYFLKSDTLKGWAVCKDTLIYTSNGGNSWQMTKFPSSNQVPRGIYMQDSQQGWIVCVGGNAYRIKSGGLVIESPGVIAGTLITMNKIYFINRDTGYAVGEKGYICHTTKGTALTVPWIKDSFITTSTYQALGFGSQSHGWAIGIDNGKPIIAFTKTGGFSGWTNIIYSFTESLLDIFASDTANVWVVGSSGLILQKDKYTETWNKLSSGTTANLRSVFFPNNEVGWAVGDNGTILKYSQNGPIIVQLTSNYSNPCEGSNLKIFPKNGLISSPVWTLPDGTKISGDTLTINSIKSSQAGTYYLNGKISINDAYGSITVEVIAAPQISSPIGAQLTCDGNPVEISASGIGTFSWTGPDGFQGYGPKVYVTKAGFYQVTLISTTGCTSTATVEVKAAPNAPVVNIQAPAQGTQLTCKLNELPLQGGSNTATALYRWTRNGVHYSYNKDTTATNPGKYILIATADPSGCTGSDTILISESKQAPTIQWLTQETAITCIDKLAVLQASATPSGASFSWQGPGVTGATGTQLTTDKPGTYLLTVTGTNGCSSVTSIQVTIDTITPRITGIQTVWSDCTKEEYGLEATGLPLNAQFQWYDQSGQPLGQGSQIVVQGTGIYTLRLVSPNGCQTEAQHEIKAIQNQDPPTIITPNGDGKNDRLVLAFCGSQGIPLSLTVYNRWGQVVYRSDDYRDDWPQGDLDPGQYYYLLRYQDKEEKYPLTILKD